MPAPPTRTAPLLRLLIAVGLVLGAAGCGGDGGADDEPSETSLIPPASTEADPSSTGSTAPGSTTSTEPASTAPSQPTDFADAARDAVNELKAAWEAGDQARARAIAPGDVVDALFLVPPDGYEVQGCDTGEFDTSVCTFRNRATEAFISVSAIRSDAGWQIATIDVNDD